MPVYGSLSDLHMYLGHTIGAEGIHPMPKKVEAIKDAPIQPV